MNKLKNLRVELKNDYEKTEFTIYEMDRENDRFIVHFQFSIFNCSAQRVSLNECLEKALESNFSIKIIRNEARMDKNNLNYSTFLPTLEGTAKQTQTRNDTKTENSVG